MEEQPFKTTKNQRVRLKLNGEDGIYARAYAGSEGWVRDQRHDELGYPLVLIEWDKNHWTYSGESDRWTFESHFDPVEEPNMDDDVEKNQEQPLDPQAFGQMMEAFGQFLQQQQGDSTALEVHSPNEPSEDELKSIYESQLQKGVELANKAEAFLLLTIHKDNNGIWVPTVWSASLQEEAGLIAEMQVAKVAAEITAQLTFDVLTARGSNES